MATPLDDLTSLPTVDTDGEPLKMRFTKPDRLRSLYTRLRDADLARNRRMARWQALLDGEPPYDPAKRKESGQAYLANYNPGRAKQMQDQSVAAYTDMINASAAFIELHTTYGEPQDAEQWSVIMSEQMSLCIRDWDAFYFRYAFIPHYMTWHGVGIAYFPDRDNWQWDVTNLGYFKIPDQTKTTVDDIEYAFLKNETQPHKLMYYIENEEYAKEQGWNIEAIKLALMNTRSPMPDLYNWLEWEARWKNDDIMFSETAPSVALIYSWVRESDGSYTLAIFAENGLDNANLGPEQFLCLKRNAFHSAREAFVLFARNIGANGTIHSIRGLGADIYNVENARMRLENRIVDVAGSAGPVFQPNEEEDMQQLQMTPFGPYTMVSPGISAMQGIQNPSIVATMMPALDVLAETERANAGQYTASSSFDTKKEMTRAEVMARTDQDATLSITSINLYYQGADQLAREIVRRFTREGYQREDPGGHAVWEWKQRCFELGVPMEAFSKIDNRRTRAARIIGFGSPAARRVALEGMMTLFPELDQFGKQQLVHDMAASHVGYIMAEVYAPKPNSSARPPMDAQIAGLQNGVLAAGQGPVEVYPNENKTVHLEVHIGKIEELIAQFNEAGQNPEMYAQIVPPLQAIYEHAAETLETYTGLQAPLFRQQLQQAGEILVNGIRHLQKEQAQQAEDSMNQGGQGIDPQQEEAYRQMEQRAIEFQEKLKQQTILFQQKLALQQQAAAQKMSLNDAQAAQKILINNMSRRSQNPE